MKKTTSTATYKGGLAFQISVSGHRFMVDADEQYGGQDLGPKPKPLLLSALGGCTGMDVTSVLHKMKVHDFKLEIEVTGVNAEEHPSIYTDIHINYFFEGEDLPPEKLKRAVELSQTRYCGVSAMLSKAANITHTILVNKKEIA